MIKLTSADLKFISKPMKFDPFSTLILPNGKSRHQAINRAVASAARAVEHAAQTEESGFKCSPFYNHIYMFRIKRDYFLGALQKIHLYYGGDCFQKFLNHCSKVFSGNKKAVALNKLHSSCETTMDNQGILTKMILSGKSETPSILYIQNGNQNKHKRSLIDVINEKRGLHLKIDEKWKA
jgi:hypothetical protein